MIAGLDCPLPFALGFAIHSPLLFTRCKSGAEEISQNLRQLVYVRIIGYQWFAASASVRDSVGSAAGAVRSGGGGGSGGGGSGGGGSGGSLASSLRVSQRTQSQRVRRSTASLRKSKGSLMQSHV